MKYYKHSMILPDQYFSYKTFLPTKYKKNFKYSLTLMFHFTKIQTWFDDPKLSKIASTASIF